tara:strand:+ start:248 stop:526 length:279 start_codon:yes stop_codon:yes gene_type:complete
MTTKKCSGCGQEKPATAEHWYHRSAAKDGLQSWCRECQQGAGRRFKQRRAEAIRRLEAIRALATEALCDHDQATGCLLGILELTELQETNHG